MANSIFITGAIGLGCLMAIADARAAESWTRAPKEYQRLGVRLLVCKDIPDELVCLGLSCTGGQSELVSIRSGSGAFTGSVEVQIPPKSFAARFSDTDDSLAALAGASASRAPIGPEIVEAMLKASKVKIHDRQDEGFTETYSTRGLKTHFRDGAPLCGKP